MVSKYLSWSYEKQTGKSIKKSSYEEAESIGAKSVTNNCVAIVGYFSTISEVNWKKENENQEKNLEGRI